MLAHPQWGASEPAVEYPDSDGEPVAENTLQLDWIILLKTNLDHQLADFVAADLFWYPVEGDPKVKMAPDTMVALGRPKGARGSYQQWEEGGVAPQVVIEVLSPGNSFLEMKRKLRFYERFGVEEYYILDPYEASVAAYLRRDGRLQPQPEAGSVVSPRLGIRFEKQGGELKVFLPDGRPFEDFAAKAKEADEERRRADDEKRRADDEKRRADDEIRRADDEKRRADALAAKLESLGIDPNAIHPPR
ncbi:MAG: Uma2 family endonuclease [Deltaproteobacteria bacterium]|nr:Uma2 family endonuclease [Deltaproteobacteria bacterium]